MFDEADANALRERPLGDAFVAAAVGIVDVALWSSQANDGVNAGISVKSSGSGVIVGVGGMLSTAPGCQRPKAMITTISTNKTRIT